MLSEKNNLQVLKIIALALGFMAASVDATTYDWPMPENNTLTVNLARGALLILTREDNKSLVSLDLQNVDIARESTLTTRKIIGDIPSKEPQWSVHGQTTTLTLPAPSDLDIQKVKGVTAVLSLPAGGQYEINGTLLDVYLKGTKNNIRINVINGKVTAQNAVSGDVVIDMMNGDILTEAMKSDLSIKLRSGSLSDKGSEGAMNIDLVSGDLTLNSLVKSLRIRQTTGTQTIDAPACENFSNDLQTGSGKIHLGTSLVNGHIFSADGKITMVIPADWQGRVVADGITGNNIVNQLSKKMPESVEPPLADERLELTQGQAENAGITLSTIGGVFTLQHPVQEGK